MNLDDSSGGGIYWVAWFKREGEKFYFDSFGLPPPTELNNYLDGDVFYPTEQIQPRQEVFCGHLCLFVLKEMQKGKRLQDVILTVFGDIIKMPVDKFGRTPTTSQNVTNVSGVSHEYLNNNFLRKGQAIDMTGQTISNLGSAQSPEEEICQRIIFSKKRPD